MANALYDAGRNAFARGDILWKAAGGSDIRAILVDTGVYTVNLATHDNLDDVTGVVGTAVALTLIDPSQGIVDANDIVFSAVTGNSVEALVIYKHTGTPSTSTLIAYIDSATGLPVTPNGGDINVAWANTTNKIFKL